jgi:AAA domain, putative AbiEii toxin, Type IV TA system/AAA ATPase domain
MFRSVSFHNFKALENFSIALRKTNVLVGPNNAGKSTVLDGFRALAGAFRYARRYRPMPVTGPEKRQVLGYQIPTSTIPISMANIHSQYREEETRVTFTLDNGRKVTLFFDEEASCRLCLDVDIGALTTTAQLAKSYPIDIAVVPTLGPFEEEEEIARDEYVRQWASGRRSHRLFRNIWYRKGGTEFDAFRGLVEQTWPGMSIKQPELLGYAPALLAMFCQENRIDREIYWAGFGFQVWLQFLTHFLAAQRTSLLIIDEPDIYLHPDLQRRLFWLVQKRSAQSIMATHSIEIINEAEPDDLVVIDKVRRTGKRITDIGGMQEAV